MKILSVCNHPGGINAILPVLIELNKAENKIHIVTNSSNKNIFKDYEFNVIFLNKAITIEKSLELLKDIKPDLLIAGTSEPEKNGIGRLEPIFIKAAKESSVSSLAILDFWSKYKHRFSLSKNNILDATPNIICVMDERAKKEMLNEGFDEKIIKVTGNPFWDKIIKNREKISLTNLSKIKKELKINKNQKNIIFISQPLSDGDYKDLGYNEMDVLNDLIKVFNKKSIDKNFEIWILPHPREKTEKFEKLITKEGDEKLRLISSKIDRYELGLAADYIVGIFSMLLIEYALLGFNVLSLQPIKSKEKILDLSFGIPLITDPDQLPKFLSLKTTTQNMINYNSTDAVMSQVNSFNL